MDEEERRRFIIGQMEKVHRGAGGHVEGVVTKSWASDRWSRGAYALWRPGQMTKWRKLIARPEGRIHSAGEHTSVLAATMEGALESGVRAAREVIQAP